MDLVVTFGLVLVLAALLSGLAARTPLSTSLVVLVLGVVLGPGLLGVVDVGPSDQIVTALAEVALVTVLFTDGQRLPLREVRRTARLAGRALLVGMPLTLLGIAALAVLLTDLTWVQALLVGAVLSPTDPVFAAAIVQREDVPERLRRLLNVESGVNDGLALPVVLILLAQSGTPQGSVAPLTLIAELLGGIALGVALPLLIAALRRVPGLGVGGAPALLALAAGISLYGLAELLHANVYLAAFVGGVTFATALPDIEHEFDELGEQLSEAAKLLALLVFATLLTPALAGQVPLGGWVLAVLALALVRPASLLVSLAASRLPRRERVAAAWFGPKGFASVVYGLLVLESGAPESQQEFALIAAAITLSVLVHSSTDVPVARWLTADTSV
jgi:NhaP-type Na+/H+ or K+/H+ antiporter